MFLLTKVHGSDLETLWAHKSLVLCQRILIRNAVLGVGVGGLVRCGTQLCQARGQVGPDAGKLILQIDMFSWICTTNTDMEMGGSASTYMYA